MLYDAKKSIKNNLITLIEKHDSISSDIFVYNLTHLIKIGLNPNIYIDGKHLLYYLYSLDISIENLPIFFMVNTDWDRFIEKGSYETLKEYFEKDESFIDSCKSTHFLIFNFNSIIVKNCMIILDRVEMTLSQQCDIIFCIKWKSCNLWKKRDKDVLSDHDAFKYAIFFNNLNIASELFSYEYVEDGMVADIIFNRKFNILSLFICKGIQLSKHDFKLIPDNYRKYIKQLYKLNRCLRDGDYFVYVSSVLGEITNNPKLINKEFITYFRNVQKQNIFDRYTEDIIIQNDNNFVGQNIFDYDSNNIVSYREGNNVWCFNYYEFSKIGDINPYTGKKFNDVFVSNPSKYNVTIHEMKNDLMGKIEIDQHDINGVNEYYENILSELVLIFV